MLLSREICHERSKYLCVQNVMVKIEFQKGKQPE